MSDIASFVAAVIRDKTVMDLQEENRNLRKDVDETRIIEVTGGDFGVWARRLFTEGNFAGNSNVWCLELPNMKPLPIQALKELKISTGGNLFSTAGNYAREGCMDPDALDGDNQKVVRFFSGKDWLSVLILGWPRESWENFDDASHGLFYDFLYQRVADAVSEDHPEATFVIRDVSFVCESVKGLMSTLQN